MNYADLTPEQREIWDDGYSHGHDAGWDEGYDNATDEAVQETNDLYDDGYNAGFTAGIEAEQKRIQDVLGMMFESALNMGQGNKAIQYKHAMDLLRPVELKNLSDDD